MCAAKNEDSIKYESGNPISRLILRKFFLSLNELLSGIQFENIYEAGCGNGYVTEQIKRFYPLVRVKSIDIDGEKISIAKSRVKDVDFSVSSIYDTRQEDESFDLVVSTEVFEHLYNPLDALKELNRISKRYLLISVPNEPVWRLANMARFKYIKSFGNTPGHINHWSKKSFRAFVNTVFNVRAVKTPFPFTILLCEKRYNVN